MYDWFADKYTCRLGWLGRDVLGRAAEFRAAWELLAVADAVIAFEPFDLVARYAIKLAAAIPDRQGRDGRGVAVRVVKRPGLSST